MKKADKERYNYHTAECCGNCESHNTGYFGENKTCSTYCTVLDCPVSPKAVCNLHSKEDKEEEQ